MSTYGYIDEIIQQRNPKASIETLTIGEVVDTNDPQQMGRIRVFCPAFGDTEDKTISQIPWATAVSPLAGVTLFGDRGPDETKSTGPVSYGMWNVPKIGAYVVVACLDGNPQHRLWLGCINPQYFPHTMPHGRYLHEHGTAGMPDGPLTSNEKPIEPLYDNLTKAFTKTNSLVQGTPGDPRRNLEWRTRGADRQVAALSDEIVNLEDSNNSKKADDFDYTFTEEDGTTRKIFCQGYGEDRLERNADYGDLTPGGKNYDSNVFSWTTPGFHSIAMDDNESSCRMRLRTTSGHQIILDDTNERIYISTAEGKTWIQIDQKGNIDIFAERNLSVKAGGDINFTTDQTFRVHAAEGIHLFSGDEIRLHSTNNTSILSNNDIHVRAKGSTLTLMSENDMNLNCLGAGYWTSGGEMHHKSGSIMYFTGGTDIHLNGPPALDAEQAEERIAYWTSRVPEHEPWARVFMKKFGPEGADNDGPNAGTSHPDMNTHIPEYQYNDPKVDRGSDERGENYNRGKNWHR